MHSDKTFLKYYLQYYEKIYRYLYFRAYEQKELTEDLTSETFLKAFEKFDTYDPERNFGSWIYTIARNCLIDHMRKHPLIKEVPLPEEDDHPLDAPTQSWTHTDENLTRSIILKSVEKLPENLREVVLLKYFNDYNNQEIEVLLGLNPSTLRVQLHRAKDLLRSTLPPDLLGVILSLFIL